MTEQEARAILQKFRKKNEDTGKEYGFIIQECCGRDGDGYVFQCKAEGFAYGKDAKLPLIGVYPDGEILSLPI